jgi:hypothetical protein
MTSEPMMPRGRSFLGSFVSSAAVATMSKPMNAKNTIDAPARMPPTPKLLGANPKSVWMSGAVQPLPVSVGSAGGTKGV